jgi:hypothetical protein
MSLQVTIIINPSDTEAGSFDIYQFVYDSNGNPQSNPFLLESNVPESSLIDPGYVVMADENAYGIRLVNNNDRGFGCDTSLKEKYFSNVKVVNNFSQSYGSVDIVGASFNDFMFTTLPLQNGSPIYYRIDTGTTVSGTTGVELYNNEGINTLVYTLTIRDSDSISPFIYSNSIPPSTGVTINVYNTFLSPDRQFIISLDSNIPPAPSQSITPMQTPMPTRSVMSTPTVTISPTTSLTPTPSTTITPSSTPLSTSSVTPTPTVTISPDTSSSPTPSITITPSSTPLSTSSVTPILTPSLTITQTPSLTPTLTPSLTITQTPSLTPSLTPTLTPSLTITQTPSLTPSLTPTSSCARPGGLNSYIFLFAYSSITGQINFTSTLDDACIGLSKLGSTTFYGETGEAASLSITEPVYIYNSPLNITSCMRLDDGYYIMQYPSPVVVYILNGLIDSYPECPAPTPSITPSIMPSETPNETPSTTPSITPTITPSISITSTPTITPTLTPSPSSVGIFTLSPGYTVNFTAFSGSGSGIPDFSPYLPTTNVSVALAYSGTIPAQNINFTVSGSLFPKNIDLMINSILIQRITMASAGSGTFTLFPSTTQPSSIFIAVNS